MADRTAILIDNLRETFRAIERFLVLGLVASLVLVALAVTDRTLSGAQKLMFADVNAPAVLVAVVAMGTYFASGVFSVLHFLVRRRLVSALTEADPAIVDALLTYPSVVSRIAAPQIIALACVGGLGMSAFFLFYAPTREMKKALLAAGGIGWPYIVLVGMAAVAAVAERPARSRRVRRPP
jgi:hypothetical protein